VAESYAGFVRECREEDRLLSLLVELGYACPLRCVFCYNDRSLRGDPLRFEEYATLLDDAAAMGVLFVTFSGGEPTVHPEFLRLGVLARELGFVVRVKTAASHLGAAAVRRIREVVDPFVVEVSLHGATAATHERQTRVPGSFDGLLSAVRAFLGLGQRLELRAVLTRWNEHELEAMFELADRLGVPLRVDPDVTSRDDGDRSPLALAPSAGAVRRLLRIGAERAGREGRPGPDEVCGTAVGRRYCGAGTSTVTIDPYGNVLPCVQWRRPVGNVHDARLAEIWKRSPALAVVRRQNEAVGEAVASGRLPAGPSYCPARDGTIWPAGARGEGTVQGTFAEGDAVPAAGLRVPVSG